MKNIITLKEHDVQTGMLTMSYIANGKHVGTIYRGKHVFSCKLKYGRQEVFHHTKTEEEAIKIITKHINLHFQKNTIKLKERIKKNEKL